MGMEEAVADAHTVDSVEEQHAGLRVPECVWVDMGQPMTLAELCQPVTDVSGEHRRSVLPRKQVIIVLPVNLAPFQAKHFTPAASRHQK